MLWHQQVIIVVAATALMFLIFELVRKRRLREEYSWLWLLTGACVMVFAFMPQSVLLQFAEIFGTKNPPAAIFFLAFCFIGLLCLQFSVRLSRQTEHMKTLAQKIALLEQEIERDRREKQGRS